MENSMDLELIYETFLQDETILTLTQLGGRFNLRNRKCQAMRLALYDKYGKENILRLSKTRLARHRAKKQWETRSRVMTDDVKSKISSANKKTWQSDDGTRREKSRKLILKNAQTVDRKEVTKRAIETRKKRSVWAVYSPEGIESLRKSLSSRILTDDTRQKMSASAKSRGFCRSADWSYPEEAKMALSEKITDLWKNGKYKRIYQSKACNEFIDELTSMGYTVEREFFVDGKPYDVRVGNVIIEFNGTYWHLDPRKYSGDFYDKSRNVYARDVWQYDEHKNRVAESAGYRIMVVWQSDWVNDKQKVLEDVRRFIGSV